MLCCVVLCGVVVGCVFACLLISGFRPRRARRGPRCVSCCIVSSRPTARTAARIAAGVSSCCQPPPLPLARDLSPLTQASTRCQLHTTPGSRRDFRCGACHWMRQRRRPAISRALSLKNCRRCREVGWGEPGGGAGMTEVCTGKLKHRASGSVRGACGREGIDWNQWVFLEWSS